MTNIIFKVVALAGLAATNSLASETQLLWGDTHLHTKLSPDTYIMGNRSLLPHDAYRYAKGQPVVNAHTRHQIQIGTPLDFLVVSDHAEYMGIIPKLFEGDKQLTQTPAGQRFTELVAAGDVGKGIYETADAHYEPGVFTSLIGWEWSSITEGANLHRIVFIKDGADKASQFLPYSLFDSDRPEDLWQWLQDTENRTGASFMAIPHNGNVSKGKMFAEVDSDGRPITAAFARTRARWEPIHEMTQIKGDGETLGDLSPEDEFDEFESYRHPMDMRPGLESMAPADKGDYARTASYTNSIGAAQLATVWLDPEFNASQSAFYYVRVLQIPTPRHSLYASVAMQQDHPQGHPATIQERAYSSPIWYTP